MRILCVAEDVPWPTTTGYRIRLATVVEALAGIAAVDLWVARDAGAHPAPMPPPPSGVDRGRVVELTRRSSLGRVARWSTSSIPRSLLEVDASAAADDLAEWAHPPYDAVWCGHLRTFLWVAGAVDAPVVLDLDNLGDAALRHRRRTLRDPRSQSGVRRSLRSLAALVGDAVDERRYQRLHARVATQVAAVAVCSDLDRARLGAPNTVVVPNAYPPPAPAATLRPPVGDAARLVMIGLLAYPPNEDAARFFIEHVLPRVRRELPGTRLRLVGRHRPSLEAMAEAPGVELVGEVDDVGPELRRADTIVVPVRFGGGTRVKILEAFAYRVPVVSTSTGCEGLDVVPDQHLLVADTPDAFARACVTAVGDGSRRAALTDAAFSLYESRYRPEVVQRIVRDTVARVAAGDVIGTGVGSVERA